MQKPKLEDIARKGHKHNPDTNEEKEENIDNGEKYTLNINVYHKRDVGGSDGLNGVQVIIEDEQGAKEFLITDSVGNCSTELPAGNYSITISDDRRKIERMLTIKEGVSPSYVSQGFYLNEEGLPIERKQPKKTDKRK